MLTYTDRCVCIRARGTRQGGRLGIAYSRAIQQVQYNRRRTGYSGP